MSSFCFGPFINLCLVEKSEEKKIEVLSFFFFFFLGLEMKKGVFHIQDEKFC